MTNISFTRDELKEILEKHKLWINNNPDGIRANLSGANLSGANLSGAYLRGAYLSGADLRGADLSGANLSCADLRGADLRGADLRDSDLRDSNLRDSNLRGADLSVFMIVPEKGNFIGFKKCRDDIIAEILIPKSAKRTSSLVGRKCRCSRAKVISLTKNENIYTEAFSQYDSSFVYKIGKAIKPDSYDDDIRVECSHGIHFFITRKEAEEY